MTASDFDQEALNELERAIRKDDIKCVARVLSTSPELLHMADPDSCLHLAASQGHLKIVQLLVHLGADINQDLELYGTPLERAASKGHLEVVKYLVKQGASLAVPRPDINPLYSAIYGGHADVARFLLEAGIDPHAVYRREDGSLKNALLYAQEFGRTEIANLLIQAGCRLPKEGVDQPIWEPEPSEDASDETVHDDIIARMAEQFGPVESLALQEVVPVDAEVHVAVHVIRPNEEHPYMTLFTTGMSDRPLSVQEGEEDYQYAELVMHLPATWPNLRNAGTGEEASWPFEWLRKVAYYPHLHDTGLGGPRTIISSDEPPVPLGPNTRQSCLLLLADFADWSPMELEDGKTVRFYTVIPIYTEERDFERKQGIVPLLQRLQQQGFTTVVSVDRANVAAARPRRK